MRKIFIILSTAALILEACQKEQLIVDQEGVSLDQTEITMKPGDTKDLTATISPSNATSNYIEWKSSDTKIAVVNSYGVVTAIGPAYGKYDKGDKKGEYKIENGTATIQAIGAKGKVFAECKVTVEYIPVTGIELYRKVNGKDVKLDGTSTVAPGGVDTIVVKYTPEDASYKIAKFESSDKSFVTVGEEDGIVAGIEWNFDNEVTVEVTAVENSALTDKVSYTIIENKPAEPIVKTFWKKDGASGKHLKGDELDSNDMPEWMEFKGGVLTWEKNESGVPRKATVKTKAGDVVTILQIEPKDFKGSYSFNDSNESFEINEPLRGESLEDWGGAKHTNNLGVKIDDAIMDASLEIDYKGQTVRLGLFLDARDNAQEYKTEKKGYPYAAFLPFQVATVTTESTKLNLYQTTLDANKDYTWLWLETTDFVNFTYDAQNNAQQVTGSNANKDANKIAGFGLVASKSPCVIKSTILDGDKVEDGKIAEPHSSLIKQFVVNGEGKLTMQKKIEATAK